MNNNGQAFVLTTMMCDSEDIIWTFFPHLINGFVTDFSQLFGRVMVIVKTK